MKNLLTALLLTAALTGCNSNATTKDVNALRKQVHNLSSDLFELRRDLLLEKQQREESEAATLESFRDCVLADSIELATIRELMRSNNKIVNYLNHQ